MPLQLPNWMAQPRTRWAIVGVHCLFLLAIFLHQGILADKEALKYIGCAEAVLRGDLTDLFGNYLKYGAYVLFLVPFVAAGVPALAVVLQVLLCVLAAWSLARMVSRITMSVSAGTVTMSLFLLCYPVQQWTLALYTESFFTSVSILFMERITRHERADAGPMVLALTTIFARPVGMLFVGPAFIWKFTGETSPRWLQRARWPGIAMVLFIAISLPGVRRAQLEPIVDVHIIAGYAEDPGAMEKFSGHSIVEAQCFLLDRHGLGAWLNMGVRRSASLFTLPRDHFSSLHNMVAGLWMLLYPLAALGSWRWRDMPEVMLVVAVLALHTLLVGLTHDEWSGRFVAPLLPWVMVLAVLGLHKKPVEQA